MHFTEPPAAPPLKLRLHGTDEVCRKIGCPRPVRQEAGDGPVNLFQCCNGTGLLTARGRGDGKALVEVRPLSGRS
ncbi:hypothetical protein [Glycomyces albidus]|uniref:Uncharacterized protein n=1 Tax=Glycomyces albidus TaxID=2656774 RepID=A0A6L5G814_9ACTN|nr:hypothetical protein [Glycomyces albidus]MQM25795.1 hypothetical protein [Glycomyces albidus]